MNSEEQNKMTRRQASEILFTLAEDSSLADDRRDAAMLGAKALRSLMLKSKLSKKARYARKREARAF